MQRRNFLALPLLATPALSQGVKRIRMATSWTKNLVGAGVSAERVARRISSLSNGRLEVQLFAAGEIVPAFAVFDAVSTQIVEMGHTASFFQAGKDVSFNYFTTVPNGLNPLQHNAWLLNSGQKLWDEFYAGYGLKPFQGGNVGASFGGWFKKPVTSLESFKGLKIRIAGLGAEVYTRLGATTLALPPAEIYPNLERGVIDAAEFTTPASDERMGLFKVAPHYYAQSFTKPNGSSELLVNKAFYDALPPDLQAVIQEATQAEQMLALAEMHNLNKEALARLAAQGVTIQSFSPEILAKVQEEIRFIRADLQKRTPWASKIGMDYDSFKP